MANDHARRRRIGKLFAEADSLANHAAKTARVALGTLDGALYLVRHTMATNEALQAKLTELKQAVIDDEAQDDANVQRLEQVIAELNQKAAEQNADTADQIRQLDEIKGSLHAPSSAAVTGEPTTTEPTPEPTPAEPTPPTTEG